MKTAITFFPILPGKLLGLKVSLLVLFFVIYCPLTTYAQNVYPLPVAGDILTFSDGMQSSGNPDVYIIDKGDFSPGTTYSVTVNRPKGAEANYPVSIEYYFYNNNYHSSWEPCFEIENTQGVLTFAAGETQQVLQFTARGTLPNNTASVYLFFGLGSRTKSQHQVVKINFNNPLPVTPIIGSDYPDETSCYMNMDMPFPSIGSYLMLSFDASYFGHLSVLDNTQLRINRRYIDHESFPVTVSDSSSSTKQKVMLKPEQAVGTVSDRLEFLYKITEDAIITDYSRITIDGVSDPAPCFVRQADSIMNMKMTANTTLFDRFPVDDRNHGYGDAIPVNMTGYSKIRVQPRFGTITANASTYNIGETITLTIPVLNSKLLRKISQNNEWLEQIGITLDGGRTFINSNQFTFNSETNTITTTVQACNTSNSPITVSAEILYRRPEMDVLGETMEDFFIYGANTSFTVTAQTTVFNPINSISFALPANNQVNVNKGNVTFNTVFNPTDATFKAGTWTSSHPGTGEISKAGVFSPKALGRTTITFTSDEVTYRLANSLPANDETLTQSFDIYVVGDLPDWGGYPYHEFQRSAYENARLSLSNYLKDSSWEKDGEVKVKVIHSDSAKYKPIFDAFEITPTMLDNYILTYEVPFDAQTFPKEVTAIKWNWERGDSICAPPYQIIISMPLKHKTGDTYVTRVMTDTFNLHIDLPHDPQVRLIRDTPPSVISGDTISLKYEVKYLPKYMVYPRCGFTISWYTYQDKPTRVYEGRHPDPYIQKHFHHGLGAMDVVEGKTGEGVDPALVPDWVELTDMGGYYNGIFMVSHKMPAPLGPLRSRSLNYEEIYEEFITNVYVETNIISANGVKEWNPQTFSDERRTKVYTPDLDIIERYTWYKYSENNIGSSMNEWQDGYNLSEIKTLVDAANISGKYSDFNAYMSAHSPLRTMNHFAIIKDCPTLDNLLIGVTKQNSSNTIYTEVKDAYDKVNISLPNDGSNYNVIMKLPKAGMQRSYTYNSESILNKIYLIKFVEFNRGDYTFNIPNFDPSLPLLISYMNGDSVHVELTKPGNNSSRYTIFEPKGIIGEVSCKQYVPTHNFYIGVSAILKSYGYGVPSIPILTKGIIYEEEDKFMNSLKSRVISSIRVTLVDEETGEKITSNAHINHITRYSKEYQVEYTGSFYDFLKTKVSCFNGNIIANTSGTVSTSSGDSYFIPISEFGYTSSGWKDMVMEIIADGYNPKSIIFNDLSYDKIDGSIQYSTIITLRKKANTLRQENTCLWTEFNHFHSGEDYIVWKSYIQDLSKLGSNSVVSYSRYADLRNAVLNLTMHIEDGWNPANLKLTSGNKRMSSLGYKLITPAEYTGFENTYVNISYRLNDFINYKELKYPTITYDGNTVAELPGLFNDETDPKIYEEEITQSLKDNVQITPNKFDIDGFGKNADLGKADNSIKRMEGFNLSLPSPLPFQFKTSTVGNRYYLRGVFSHNFINDVPIVGQANMGMEMYSRLEEFDAAFDEVRKSLKMKPKNESKHLSSANAFAGVRGYLEGYGAYDPFSGSWEYGLNEGGVSAEISASAYTKTPIAPGLNVGIGVEGLVSATLGMSKPSDEDWAMAVNKAKFDLWLETKLSLDVTAEVTAGANIGIAGAEIGVRGKAGLLNQNKLILKPYLADNKFNSGGMFKVYANMYAYAHAYFLFWSWANEWKIFDVQKEWYYPDDSTNPYKTPQLRSLSDVYIKSSLSLPNSIINDVAANAYPRYFGDGTSLLFQNINEPLDKNDDRISVYHSGSTSDMLPDFKLPSFGFDVSSSTSGATVVAFEQMSDSIHPVSSNVLDDTYFKTQSNNVDVYASFKTGTTWQTTQLSNVGVEWNNKKANMQPKTAISPNGSTAAVIWKSGLVKVDSLEVKFTGDLMLSRYNGTAWSEPLKLISSENLGDYNLAIDGDSIVVATVRIETTPSKTTPGENETTGKIKLIYVSATDSIVNIETGMVGHKPQIVRTDNNYYVSFMTSYAKNDTTNVNDVYMLATTKNGQAIDSISGFAGMTNKVSFSYKLVGDNTASSINDLAIIYNASKTVNDGDVQTSLYAAKFGTQGKRIFASEPKKVLTLADDGSQLLASFDGYKQGNEMKVAAAIANDSHGAIVVEDVVRFENKITCLSESYNSASMKAGQQFNIEFYVQNSGFKPVSSIEVVINEADTTNSIANVLPGGVYIAKSKYYVPIANTDPVPYNITATFEDGSTATTTGMLDLTAYSLDVNLISLKTTDTKNTALIEIVNQSATPLTASHEVTVGVYEDIFGETLYPGTVLKTFTSSEFYNSDGSDKSAITVFDIPVVSETNTVYAIAKVKRNYQLRSANGITNESDNVEQTKKSYASIQLFPVRTEEEGTPTDKVEPEMKDEANGPVQIYSLPGYAKVKIRDFRSEEKLQLRIHNLSGMLIHDATISDNVTLVPLKQGVYIVSVGTTTKKIIITQNASSF